MIISWCFICVFAVLINKVFLKKTVEAVIGGSVLLPFSFTQHDLKPQDMDVIWRHNDSETVYDLIKGQVSVLHQNPRYQSRAETFPEEYRSGNFSLKLINLTRTDTGEFSCLLLHSSETQTVQLIINESTAEKGKNSTEHGNQELDKSPDQMKKLICFSILPVLFFLVTTAIFIRCWIKKRRQASFQQVPVAK
ncbi:uncharacterized protein LOC143736170 [Siphateles boraxobius]|uniref:uncharacterized protein LOC143736170 n=1 Tax=Siphateles boraxobius TaxID=180520 RepID=UPI004063ACF0